MTPVELDAALNMVSALGFDTTNPEEFEIALKAVGIDDVDRVHIIKAYNKENGNILD